MQLLQLLWEDQNKLFFKFKKDERDREELLPEKIKSINIKYELSKKEERAPYLIQEPFLVSIKNFHFSANIFSFSIQLDALSELNKLQINIIRLTFFHYSGDREEIFINKIYQLSEISYNDGDLIEITEEELVYETKTRYSVKKQSLNKPRSQKIKQQSISNNRALEKKQINNTRNITKAPPKNMTISISYSEYKEWFKIKEDKSWDTTFFIVRNGYKKMKQLEREIRTLNSTIRKIALKNTASPATPIYLQAPPNMIGLPNHLNPPEDVIPSRNINNHSLNEANAQKVLRNEKNTRALSGQIQIMKEMKEKFNNVNNVKELLSKVPKEELNKERARTDHLAFLEFKEKSFRNSEKDDKKKFIKKLKDLGCKDKLKNSSLEELKEKIKLFTNESKEL